LLAMLMVDYQNGLRAHIMKVGDLKKSLEDMAAILEVGGTKTARDDMASILSLLEGAEDQELDEFLASLEKRMAEALKKTRARSRASRAQKVDDELVSHYAGRLKAAEMDEASFKAIAAELKNDPRVRKAELAAIAREYDALPAKTVAGLHKAIQTRFYERIYDRDATEMARRATPW